MRKVRKKKVKKLTSKMQGNLLFIFCVVVLAFIVLIGRLLFLNYQDGEKYEKRVLSQQTYVSKVMPFKRGTIMDRNKTKLAMSERVYNVILDINNILEEKTDPSTDPVLKDGKRQKVKVYLEPTKAAITKCFNVSDEELDKIIKENPKSKYYVLLKELSYDQISKFNKLAKEKGNEYVQGVWFEEEYKRIYPMRELGCSVIGFTEKGNVGRWGIEESYNEELNGTNGREYGYFDSELNLERNVKAAVNGNTIVSTIDANVQGIVEKHIKKFNKDMGAKNIAVMIANPNNAEILAMSAYPFYDLNEPRNLEKFYKKEEIKAMNDEDQVEALSKAWRNFCISNIYEPGSTFKPFTVAMALEEAKIKQNSTYVCDAVEEINGSRITCNNGKPHGTITLQESLMKSCNDAMMQLGRKIGRKDFAKYEKIFGFGSKTDIDLPGEESGIIYTEDKLNPVELATCSFGQSNTVTMVQMMGAFCSTINGGKYYKPHVVKQILNDKGATLENIEPILVRETVSKETSEFIKKALLATVEDGTAKPASVKGYSIGGKTGTAQKRPLKDKKFLVSFIGCAPAESPEVAIYVIVDEPDTEIQANSKIAQGLAADIMKEVMPFLSVYPDSVKKTK